MDLISRRLFLRSALQTAAAAPVLACVAPAFAKPDRLVFGAGRPFSFEGLIERAKGQAAAPYVEPYRPAPEIVKRIDYEVHGKLRFKSEYALFAESTGVYPATFFHVGQLFQKSVKMHAVEAGQAREILYSPSYFQMPADSIARKLPKDSGFAGFRLQEAKTRSDWKTQDWVAFLGAAYLRSIGSLGQYGLSARGVAVNTTATGPEEFPDFTEFYLEPAATPDAPVIIYALLDGPSLSGAYRFACKRDSGVIMDVDCALFTRKDIQQLGIAPLTSMFWFGEYNRADRVDWRPEVHDSDGLVLWTGAGERIMRPLNSPSRVITSSFFDKSPKGFGLMQRDRDVEHYLDGVNYDLRPSLWVEPIGDWGEGAVSLVEIPTDDEIHDNIVAFWMSKQPVKAGNALRYRYRLYWQGEHPFAADSIASVWSTRIGRGGEPGKPRPKGVTKFVIDFAGKPLENLGKNDKLTAEISASRGTISNSFVEPTPRTKRHRAQFDLTVSGTEPVEIRMFLRKNKQQTVSETWLYQFEPRA
ncbi:MAG TPA: glucan biosynthesis protein D [Polyangiales bacterium]|nr:glucan biosynthesis protein D [Polyangiales bacterium]